MHIHNDGYKFKLYLEGIRVPFLSADINYERHMSSAQISIFPSKNLKDIPEGTLVHIFFKKIGEAKEYKLLFFGSISGIIFGINDSSREYRIIAFGRMSFLNNLLVGSFMQTSGSASNTVIVRHDTSGGSKTKFNADQRRIALGLGDVAVNRVVAGDRSRDTALPNRFISDSTRQSDAAKAKDITSEDELKPDNTAARPAANTATKAVETAAENLSRLISEIINEACETSHDVYSVNYHHRLFIEKAISELPATFLNIISEDEAALARFSDTIEKTLIGALGSFSSLNNLISLLMHMFYSEMHEIPGLTDGAFVIMPDLIQSDIPMCNLIFPSERSSITFQDNAGNKITRVVLPSHQMTISGDVKPQGNAIGAILDAFVTTKNNNVTALAVFPDTFDSDELQGFDDLSSEMQKTVRVHIDTEKHVGSRIRHLPALPDFFSANVDGGLHAAMAEHDYYKLADSHRALSISRPFAPYMAPGFKAIMMDKFTPLIFKINSLSHQIRDGGALVTSLACSQVEYLDKAVIRTPFWFDPEYDVANISAIYERHLGCKSMSGYVSKTDMYEAYEYLHDKYKSSETKSYLTDAITQRYLATESEVFALYGASATQGFDDAADGEGALIYKSKTFDNYAYNGYDVNMSKIRILSDRQGPVLAYIKTIYGIIGDTYE